MNELHALVSMAQTMLRVRGEWYANPRLDTDIRNVVTDVWHMMNVGDDTIIEPAIYELEQRAVLFLKELFCGASPR